MSTTYTAYALIGVQIDSSRLTTLEKERGCHCKVKGIKKMKFCPSCGASALVDKEVPIPQFKEDLEEWKEFPCCQSLSGYPIIYTDSGYNGTAYVAAAFVEDDQYSDESDAEGDGRMQIPANLAEMERNLAEMREKMKNALGPIGFWDEKKFGIWAVLRTS